MSKVVLTDALLAKLAGWEVVKQARSLVAADRVLSSQWQAPLLRGVVQDSSGSLRAGLVINNDLDAENLCHCRDARQRGIICAHAVAVGLHYLKSQSSAASPGTAAPSKAAPKPAVKALQRVAAGGAGEPLEISVILPPNFAEAAARGKVMFCLEGRWRGGGAPLNALPFTMPFALSAQDAALLEAIESLNAGDTPAMLMLSTSQFSDVLPKLAGHPRVTLGGAQPLKISADPLRPDIVANLEPGGEIVVRQRDDKNPSSRCLIRGSVAWIFTGESLQPLGLPAGLEELSAGPMRIPRHCVPTFLNLHWPRLLAQCDVEADFSIGDFQLEKAKPRFRLHLAGGLAALQAKLECFYDGQSAASMLAESPWLPDPASPTRYRTRDFAAEEAAQARLARSGFGAPDAQGFSHLEGQNPVLNFFAREYPRMEKEWDVTLEERLERSTRQNLERIQPRFQVTPSGEQWFDFNVAYETGSGDRFAAADIQRLLLSGQSHSRLKDGKFALLDTGAVEELQEVLLDCAPQQHGGGYRMGNQQAGFLDATLRQWPGWQVQAPSMWAQRAAQQRGEAMLEPPPLGALEPVLRPYQKAGVGWLQFLRSNGFGGILADEMGLGKTLQTLGLLAATRLADSAKPGASSRGNPAASRMPHLVVCPASLVFNWAAEAARFTPGLRVLALHGPQRRELFPRIASHDLVVTSYTLLRRDAELYRGLEFDTVVLDEAQHIKNRQTQNAQAVKAIRCRHRLVLTGTPLENSVLDLWSIFDYLMPGYLGSAQDFRERYELPISRDKSDAAQNRLARRLRPFLLRRLKRDVAADLPEKIEHVSYCEMTPQQRALYGQVLEASRREVVNAVEANGMARSRMVVLTALLRLRQICCDPRLLNLTVPPSEDSDAAAPAGPQPRGESDSDGPGSGKVELFEELLEEVLDGGHRVLVFSQFTAMLALLREQLSAADIEFCYLDGSTKNRAEVVGNFQREDRIPVFLISLKAGGVGLNLTGADTVIHFDPWWNPAVEAQATDRAHRIGQKKVVTSYKLITRGTVEEKILSLHRRKRAIFEGMLGGEEQLTEALTWEEIRDLLAE